MEWHVDDSLCEPAQVEVVLTIDNTSDCCTMWKPHDRPALPNVRDGDESDGSSRGKKNKGSNDRDGAAGTTTYQIQSVQTTPNSALIVRAGGAEHKVSPLTSGRRTILKMAFAREGATRLEGAEGHASQHHHGGRKGRKEERRRRKGGRKRRR